MAVSTIIPVILSGGVGSRLWPLSRVTTPKQLRSVLGDHTMVQATALRLRGLAGVDAPFVVCNRLHVETVAAQLSAVGCTPSRIIGEPVGRSTAAAVAAAALLAPADATLVVLPADHLIADVDGFAAAAATAAEAAATGALVTFGIVPSRPETGYGYIRLGEETAPGIRRVEAFVEKPDAATAAAYVAEGSYVWNSGMFVFTVSSVLDELARHAPDILAPVKDSLAEGTDDGLVVTPGPSFAAVPSVSFDVAVMERTSAAVVIPLAVGWSDVGSWATLWEIDEHDVDGNVVRGDAVVRDVHRSYVRADGRLVAVVGLDDVVVVDTGDAVLVAARDRVDEVKEIVEGLHADGRPEVR